MLMGAADALEVAVFFDALLKDVDQLEIEREGACRRNRFHEIHLADQLGHGITADRGAIAGHRVAQLFHPQKPLGLIRRTFTAQHSFPKVLHQGQTLLQKLAAALDGLSDPRPVTLRSLGGGREH